MEQREGWPLPPPPYRAASLLPPCPTMHLRQAQLLLLTLVASASLVASQNAPDEVQVGGPNAQCKQDVRDQITSCLDQVEQDESKLKTGPCSSSDWKCICTKQQGMVDCYSPCPGLQPVDMLKFNENSCKGQNGQTINAEGGDLAYTWSSLPFTATNAEPFTATHSGNVAPSGSGADDSNSSATTAAASVDPTAPPATAINTSAAASPAAAATTKPSTASTNTTAASSTASVSKDGATGLVSMNGQLLFGITSTSALLFVLLIV